MAYGVKVFGPDGTTVWLDTTTYTGKLLGVTTITANTDGSVTDSDFAIGTPYYLAIPTTTTSGYSPVLSFNSSTNTLSWAWGTRTGQNHQLIYGVF